jgi:hypothetical protein
MSSPTEQDRRRISGIAALEHPGRCDLYRLLAERDDWVTRDHAAEALGTGAWPLPRPHPRTARWRAVAAAVMPGRRGSPAR